MVAYETAEQFAREELVSPCSDLASEGLSPHEKKAIGFFGGPPARILDLGCGAGRTTRVLGEGQGEVIGTGISAEMSRAAGRLLDYVARKPDP